MLRYAATIQLEMTVELRSGGLWAQGLAGRKIPKIIFIERPAKPWDKVQTVKRFRIDFASSIRRFLYCLLVVNTSVVAASDVADPEEWYVQSYGPVWIDRPWDKLDQILGFYHPEITVHETDGELVSLRTESWMVESLEEWVADGWVSSEVPDVRVNRVNASTATFTTRWLDHYKNREDEYSCAWYLADLMEGQWKFTHIAPVDCATHGF